MEKVLRLPKVQILGPLLLIFLSAFLTTPRFSILTSLFLAVLTAVLADLFFSRLRRIPAFPPYAAIVSGVIIALLTSPATPWPKIVAVSAAAIFSKNLVKLEDKHIFNPAGFGLFLASLIFNQPISWWAVSWQKPFDLAFLALFSPLVVSAFSTKRLATILSFLLSYGLIGASTSQSLLDPTVLFFSLVMLPEPMTSPRRLIPQVAFGIFVALASIFVSFTDPLIFSLLLANLVFFKFFH